MNKKIILSMLLLAAFQDKFYAQVGISTETPRVTLDIVGSPTIASKLDGVSIPNITADQLGAKNYTGDNAGTILYVTQPPVTPPVYMYSPIKYVRKKGLYKFDGSYWRSIDEQEFIRIYGSSYQFGFATQNRDEFSSEYFTLGNYAIDLGFHHQSSSFPQNFDYPSAGASGEYSVVSGGSKNIAAGTYNVISGGIANKSNAQGSVVAGGYKNNAEGTLDISWGEGYATISGGKENRISKSFSTIGGGRK